MTKVLLLDDEQDLREEVASFLRERGGFEVVEVGTIKQFYQYFKPESFDIVVLDAMLPDGDGAAIAEEVRRDHPRCGVVMFTARDSTRDRINGYRSGVDHYITKPIRMDEFLAMLEALARRVCTPPAWSLQLGGWSLTSPQGVTVRLTAMEYRFLAALNARHGQTLTRRQLIDQLGKDAATYDDRNLDALVLRLRRKVRELTEEDLPLKTVHGAGYVLSEALVEKKF